MKEVIRMTLTRREHGVLLRALNELRNHMIEQSMPTEGVDFSESNRRFRETSREKA